MAGWLSLTSERYLIALCAVDCNEYCSGGPSLGWGPRIGLVWGRGLWNQWQEGQSPNHQRTRGISSNFLLCKMGVALANTYEIGHQTSARLFLVWNVVGNWHPWLTYESRGLIRGKYCCTLQLKLQEISAWKKNLFQMLEWGKQCTWKMWLIVQIERWHQLARGRDYIQPVVCMS